MCCFSRPVQSVSGTNIFARSDEGGRQFVVYSLTLRAKEELAMVLPFPVKQGSGEKAITFIDLKEYPEFFTDLRKGFPEPLMTWSASESRSVPPPAAATLEVVNVGSFDASFVPTVADFARLDGRFRLPPGTWEKLSRYRDYGFAVFKLKPGNTKVHPMAFSFPRANPLELFFPTVHIHDGKVHDKARFDHTLFAQYGPEDEFSLLGWDESIRHAGAFLQISKTKGIVESGRHCYKRELSGSLPNQDTIVRPA